MACFDRLKNLDNGVLMIGCEKKVWNGYCGYKCYFPFHSREKRENGISFCVNGEVYLPPQCFVRTEMVVLFIFAGGLCLFAITGILIACLDYSGCLKIGIFVKKRTIRANSMCSESK
ncbi:hypothetical protein MHBO_004215 [Bonamia ostreae]|uniref:Uncharacterized protein n=1 Tax=Bonamia ostreae TaxID=126728 RepID=A0ABV2ASS7_9EUKA